MTRPQIDSRATTVVAVFPGNANPADVRGFTNQFVHLHVAAQIHHAEGVSNQEEGGYVFVCTDPVRSGVRSGPRCGTTTDASYQRWCRSSDPPCFNGARGPTPRHP